MQRRGQHRARRNKQRNRKNVAAMATATRRRAQKAAAADVRWLSERIAVNTANLRPTNSYGTPAFVTRGYYVDFPFKCKDCGKSEVWTPTQQRWWYEIAKGDVRTVATRCRPCRQRERTRRLVARESTEAGMARKRSMKPNTSLERSRGR
jgi:hypothetical protein